MSAITAEMIKESEVPESVIPLRTAVDKYSKRFCINSFIWKNTKFGNQFLKTFLNDGKNKDRIPKFEIFEAFSQFGPGETKKKDAKDGKDDADKKGGAKAAAATAAPKPATAEGGQSTEGAEEAKGEEGYGISFPLDKNDKVLKEFCGVTDDSIVDGMFDARVTVFKDPEMDKRLIRKMMTSAASVLQDEVKAKAFGDNLKIKIPATAKFFKKVGERQMMPIDRKECEGKAGRYTVIFTWPRVYLQGGVPPKTYGKVFIAEQVLYIPLAANTDTFTTPMEIVTSAPPPSTTAGNPPAQTGSNTSNQPAQPAATTGGGGGGEQQQQQQPQQDQQQGELKRKEQPASDEGVNGESEPKQVKVDS